MSIPTWGYKPDGSAQIFDLKEGADLPEGWFDRPGPQESESDNSAELSFEEPLSEIPPKKRGRPPRPPEDTGL